MVEVYPSSYAYNGVATIPEDSPIDDVSRVAAAAVAARVLMSANHASRPENSKMTREEHAAMMQELSKKRAGWRTPRRGWSSTDSPAAAEPTPSVKSPLANNVQFGHVTDKEHSRHSQSLAAQQPAALQPADAQSITGQRTSRPRPPLPPPRRSYSVMDYEPPSATHRPSARMAITDLPAELHYVVFDFLDPIDSTCLGLTNSHFYNIHRRIHGSVPLSSRREGPNDLEWAWRGAGPIVHPEPTSQPKLKVEARSEADGGFVAPALQRASTSPANAQVLEKLRVKGQVYCRKCGISRCELHRHLKEWMASAGKKYEYCAVTCKYGAPAAEDAKEFCYLKSPKRPHRCGRHAAKSASGTQTPKVAETQQRA